LDLFTVVRSLEQFLYEAMTWLIFYPRTMWRALVEPLRLMHYSDEEQRRPVEQRYADSVSPPLFLMLSLFIAHGLEIAAHANPAENRSALRVGIFRSHEGLLMARSLLYGLYPLLFATALMKRLGMPLDRDRLRGPFYAQCYAVAPFAIQVGIASLAARMANRWFHVGAPILLVSAVVGYIWVESKWFQECLQSGYSRSLLLVLWVFLKATLIFLIAILGIALF
jgi:hypothetical protein